MARGDQRWTEVTRSQFTHEAEGLGLVRALLPQRDPFRAWSNFEFRDNHGKWHEVDLLVVGQRRLHLVELKYYSGTLRRRSHLAARRAPGRGLATEAGPPQGAAAGEQAAGRASRLFIRFCEDNGLLRPVWITGPGVRRQEALDAQLAFFRQHPEDTDREWLMDAVGYLSRLPATRALVESHSALYLVSPRDEDGSLIHDLANPSLSSRFLRDLYPGPVTAREGHVRAAADAGVRRGVHPGPDDGARPGRAAA